MATPVHASHRVANLILPAISVEPEINQPNAPDFAVLGNDKLINHIVILSIRVHTGYIGWPKDPQTTVRLLDSIVDKMQKNKNLSEYRIMDFSASSYDEDFDDSATTGGQVNVTLHTLQLYAQE